MSSIDETTGAIDSFRCPEVLKTLDESMKSAGFLPLGYQENPLAVRFWGRNGTSSKIKDLVDKYNSVHEVKWCIGPDGLTLMPACSYSPEQQLESANSFAQYFLNGPDGI